MNAVEATFDITAEDVRATPEHDSARLARRWVRVSLLVLMGLVAALVATAGFAVRNIYTLGDVRYVKEAAPIFASGQDALVEMLNEETAVRAYVITADSTALKPYRQGLRYERLELAELARNPTGDPQLPAHVATAKTQVDALDRYFASEIALVRRGSKGQREAAAGVLAEKTQFDRFRRSAQVLESDAVRIFTRARNEQHHTYVVTLIVLLCGGLVALAIALVLLFRIPSRLYRLYRHEEEARRAAENGAEAVRALTHVGDAVALIDSDGVIRSWNPAAERLFGLPADSGLGRLASSVAPQLTEVREHAASGDSATPVMLAGQRRWLAVSESPFPDGSVVVIRDVTDDRELERMRSEFVATAAHELRTPLAAVYGAIRTMRGVTLELDQREQFLALIETESERLRTITDQLLITAQLDSAAPVDVYIEPVDLGELIASLASSALVRWPGGLDLDVIQPPSPVFADTDAPRLHQVVSNLLENAIKYSPRGGQIQLRVAKRGGYGAIDVADQGLGIPAEEQDRIFEKFYRLDPDMARGVGGSGLGLHIARELIRRMNGTITVSSQAGSGSTFTILLPLAPTPSAG